MVWLLKYVAKHEEFGNNNENACIAAAIGGLAVFDAMTFYFLYTDKTAQED